MLLLLLLRWDAMQKFCGGNKRGGHKGKTAKVTLKQASDEVDCHLFVNCVFHNCNIRINILVFDCTLLEQHVWHP